MVGYLKLMSQPQYNLFDSEVLASPYEIYKTIRDRSPVYFDQRAGFWVVTSYKHVNALLRHPHISSDRTFMAHRQLKGLPEESIQDYKHSMDHSMLMMDPPRHTSLRKIANRGFTGPAIAGWENDIRTIFIRLLDQALTRHTFDFTEQIATKFPTEVICELFGIPQQDREAFKKRADTIARFFGQTLSPGEENVIATVNESSRLNQQLINEIIEARIDHPCDDMISRLISGFSVEQGDRLQLISLCLLIITAGHVTTIDLLCNGVYTLLKHRDQWELLKKRVELLEDAVEEILRFDTSVPFTFRVAKQEIELDDQTLPKGSLIALGLAAANHDPELCANPDAFDIERGKTRHLSFAVGAHTCLGAPLARLEMKIALESLLERAPEIDFIEDSPPVVKSDTVMFKGFKSLPLEWTKISR